MTAIAGNNASAYGATASMLRNAASSSAGAASRTNSASGAGSKNPKDAVELSDYAKTMLTRARTERAAANKLAALVAEVVLNGKGKTANKIGIIKPEADDATALFKALAGQSDKLHVASDAEPPQALSDIDPADQLEYVKALIAANRGADGTVKSYRVEVHDVVKVPSTPEEIEQWFKTDGQRYVVGASQVNDADYNVMAQAIQNRTLKIQNATDIPGLNFHNTIVFAGGESGGSVNGTYTYNRDADFFKDPTMNYSVGSTGIVLSWKKDPNA